jgi:hypothetical protein
MTDGNHDIPREMGQEPRLHLSPLSGPFYGHLRIDPHYRQRVAMDEDRNG